MPYLCIQNYTETLMNIKQWDTKTKAFQPSRFPVPTSIMYTALVSIKGLAIRSVLGGEGVKLVKNHFTFLMTNASHPNNETSRRVRVVE